MSAVDLTQSFLGAVFSGQLEEALALTAPEARFISVSPRASAANPLHGTFVGPEGAKAFFGGFGALLEPGEFSVEAAFGDDHHAALYGQLRHTVRATGKPFVSDWALITRVEGGKLTLYHFYEDSDALTRART